MNVDYSQLETGDLGKTDTYRKRAWGWHPSRGAGLGLLMIECTKGNVRDTFHYEVEELPPLPGLMGREFRLTKHGAEPAEYLVAIGPLSRCSCMAGQTRGKEPEPCKHLAAMRAIEARGLLGDPLGLLADPPSGLWFHDEAGEPTAHEALSPGGI